MTAADLRHAGGAGVARHVARRRGRLRLRRPPLRPPAACRTARPVTRAADRSACSTCPGPVLRPSSRRCRQRTSPRTRCAGGSAIRSSWRGAARTHHAVVTAAAAAGPVVPMPLATLFTGAERAAAALGGAAVALPHGPGAGDAAARNGPSRSTWDARRPHRTSTGAEPGAGARRTWPGCAAASATGRPGRTPSCGVTDHVHGSPRASPWPPYAAARTATAVTGKDRPQVLNAAFLVDDGRAPAMVGAVRALAGTHAGLDVRIDVSGPWVPYSFTGDGHDGTAL